MNFFDELRNIGKHESSDPEQPFPTEEETTPGSIASSLTAGSSRLFEGVRATKNGFIDGLSSRIDQVGDLLKKGPLDFGGDEDGENAAASSTSEVSKRKPPPRPLKRPTIGSFQSGSIEDPENRTQAKQRETHYEDSDVGSTDTEGCDEDEGRAVVGQSGSCGSIKSWNSAELEEPAKSAANFMKQFVKKIFDVGYVINPEDKAQFGEFAKNGQGRIWFARYVQQSRVEKKCVEETTFYRLVQFFAVCLFECGEEEDYITAKSLMNMSFTFYYESEQAAGSPLRHFLYNHIKEQPIWQSLRFWNAAFFHSVQTERARRPTPTRRANSTEKRDDGNFQQNISFGQLGTFTCNMKALGLNKDFSLQFLRKQATIANLSDEQLNMLKENIECWDG